MVAQGSTVDWDLRAPLRFRSFCIPLHRSLLLHSLSFRSEPVVSTRVLSHMPRSRRPLAHKAALLTRSSARNVRIVVANPLCIPFVSLLKATIPPGHKTIVRYVFLLVHVQVAKLGWFQRGSPRADGCWQLRDICKPLLSTRRRQLQSLIYTIPSPCASLF